MDATDIRDRLSAPWREVRVLAQSPSTNADVAAEARAGAPEGLVVVTANQTAGRGRLDRRWESPPGAGLAVSVLLRPGRVPPARWPWLPLLAGVAVRAAVGHLGGLDARLKWPNDVLVEGGKVAGILLERVDGGTGPAAVVGVGVNVRMERDQLPVAGATSLSVEGAVVDPGDLLVALLERLGRAYRAWSAAAGDPASGLREQYVSACATLGTRVRVRMPDGSDLCGTAVDVDGAGRLVVDTGGSRVVVGAGDVVHLRPGS